MKTKLIICLFLIFLTSLQTITGQPEEKKSVGIDFSGFVRTDFFYDSRKTFHALEGLVLWYPLDKKPDRYGHDLHEVSSVGLLSISSRLQGSINGPEFLGAETSAFIEFDFTGRSNTASVRYRQGWIKLAWERSELLAGRAWHPLFVEECFPSVRSVNIGLPFQVFNRSPQVSLSYKLTKKTEISGSFIYQSDYLNYGPLGKRPDYLRNAKTPNINLALKYHSKHFSAGIMGDFKQLVPETEAVSPVDSLSTKTREQVNSLSGLAYVKYQNRNILCKAKAMFGQNLSDMLLPGGYAIREINNLTGEKKYTPSNNLYLWANFVYGHRLKGGIFAGYTKNYGFSHSSISEIYTLLDPSIDEIYRISPQIRYEKNRLGLSAELEYTSASYGNIDYNDYGKVKNKHTISNTRILLTLNYKF